MRVLAAIALLIVASLLSACQIVMGPTPGGPTIATRCGRPSQLLPRLRSSTALMATIQRSSTSLCRTTSRIERHLHRSDMACGRANTLWISPTSLACSVSRASPSAHARTEKEEWRCGGCMSAMPNTSNQALERTADRRDNLLSMTSTLKCEAQLALVSGRSSCSR